MSRTDKGFQPILAERKTPVLEKLQYPKLASPKLDGIRCLIRGGRAVSRKLKDIPNVYVQDSLRGLPDGLDGELVVGNANTDRTFNATTSGVMSRDGEPDFKYMVFDFHIEGEADRRFIDRLTDAEAIVEDYKEAYPWLEIVAHSYVYNADDVAAYEEKWVQKGYEGLILRSLDGPYKYGRCTMKEQTLLKVKRFTDAEALVIGAVERMHNSNAQERDERGYAKRSHAKAGKVGTGTLGALICRLGVRKDGALVPAGEDTSPDDWVDFEIGTGFTDEERATLWARRDTDLIGTFHTFKFQGLTPDERKPRFPVWKGERHADDIFSTRGQQAQAVNALSAERE